MRFRNHVEYTHDLVSAKPSLTGILKQKLSTRATSIFLVIRDILGWDNNQNYCLDKSSDEF
jgi:hypothetical protein